MPGMQGMPCMPENIQKWIRLSQTLDSRPSTLARLPSDLYRELYDAVTTFSQSSIQTQTEVLRVLQDQAPFTYEWLLDVIGMKMK